MSMTKVTTTQQGLTVMTAPRGGTFRRASLGAPPGRLPRGAGTAAGGGGRALLSLSVPIEKRLEKVD